MPTVDKFLSYLCYNHKETLTTHWSQRDKKVLVSLNKQIQSGNFLTENQGKLLLKILKENWAVVTATITADISLIEDPQWSEPFRVIDQLRKIFISMEENPKIVVEFTYNKLRLLLCILWCRWVPSCSRIHLLGSSSAYFGIGGYRAVLESTF